MRSFVLLIVIASLFLIGQSVPITNQGQPTVKKMLSMTNAEKINPNSLYKAGSSIFSAVSKGGKAMYNGGKAIFNGSKALYNGVKGLGDKIKDPVGFGLGVANPGIKYVEHKYT